MELDKDLQARQQARELARKAEIAQRQLADMPQQKLDTIVRTILAMELAATASVPRCPIITEYMVTPNPHPS